MIKEGSTEESGIILSFWWPANVYADVCDNQSLLDPPIGPSVGDLAIALAHQSGAEATDPTPITVDGYHGQLVELSVRTDVADCSGLSGCGWTRTAAGGAPTATRTTSCQLSMSTASAW